jgi:ADP-dependent NAD(P)H-hydrate dehydratase / NAD(P)H-hydrate epimerase
MKIFTTSQVKQIDQFTIDNEPISSINLMERAAWQCTSWIIKHFGRSHPVKIFCGCGNNGGDGLAIARQLCTHDYHIDVYLIKLNPNLSDDAEVNYQKLKDTPGIKVNEISKVSDLPGIDNDDIVIDALFGSGLNRPLSGLGAEVIDFLNRFESIKIAIDIPSGLMGEGISNKDAVFIANYTLTFQFPFLSFLLPENQQFVGKWEVLDIGLHKKYIQELSTPYHLTSNIDINLKKRPEFGHKGTFGHALIIAGSKGMAGASILSSKACLRTGCGLVTIHTPSNNAAIIQASFPEALVSYDLANDFITKLPDTKKYNAVAIGPGIGTNEQTKKALFDLFKTKHDNLVIDADALNIVSQDDSLLKLIPKNSIITPHPGEFDRLFGESKNSYERLMIQQSKAKDLGIIIILKGRYTSIALPTGLIYFNPTGNNGMATAGSGDVLTGMLVSLLAQGYQPAEAARVGTYLHGLAGDTTVAKYCKESIIASDIIENIYNAFMQFKNELE